MPRNTGKPYFYLKPPPKDNKPAANETQLIMMLFKYNSYRLVYSTGERVAAGRWNKETKTVIGKTDTVKLLNARLKNIKDYCFAKYEQVKTATNRAPVPDELRKALDTEFKDKDKPTGAPGLFELIERFKNGEIKSKGKSKAPATLKGYGVTLKHLKDYQAEYRKNSGDTKYNIDFDGITLDFYYKFINYLESQGNKPNTIGGRIKHLKAFMSEAVDLGLTANTQFRSRKFIKPESDTDGVYLTSAELMNIHRLDLSNNKRLLQARDLFLIGCCTGLRFSDYSNIKPENIVLDDGDCFIKIRTQKTGELVIIPCNPIIIEILDRYKDTPGKLPKTISNQKFNDYVKDVCKEAKLTDTGRLSTDMGKKLHECVSSHTARRSFATNLYLEGFPNIEIMKITGHKTEKAFLKYIKVSKLDAARRLNEHIKKNWSAKILKVA